MDTARLAAIRAREQAASRGPWEWEGERVPCHGQEFKALPLTRFVAYALVHADVHSNVLAYEPAMGWLEGNEGDYAFIAAARADVPDLLAEIERLQTEIQDMRLNELARLGQEMGQWEPDYPIRMGEQIRLVVEGEQE